MSVENLLRSQTQIYGAHKYAPVITHTFKIRARLRKSTHIITMIEIELFEVTQQ